jgi:cytochrome c biogenesis protein CcmG/thiol:disulfide interchange protein DsbE
MSHGFRWRPWVAAAVIAIAIAMWPGWGTRALPGTANAANLDFVLKDMTGKDVRLADYRGRPIVLNFWATWCGPCRLEIPALVELVDKYKDQHLAVLGVSVDDQPSDLQRFAAEYHMNYPVLVGLGQDAFQEAYDAVVAIPVTWFIRADGTIHLQHKGPATKEWFDAQVKALVGAAPQVSQ